MNNSLTRYFYALSLFLLTLPAVIFLFAWVKPFVSIPFFLIAAAAAIQWFRKTDFEEIPFWENRRRFAWAFLLIFLWTASSGIGGYAFQNSDHYYRNAILRDLVTRSWPVFHEGTPMVYYFGFFLPPALGGKCLLALGAGENAAMELAFFLSFAQTLLFLSAIYLLICVYLKRFSLWPLCFFILFSGLDIVPYLLFHHPLAEGQINPGLSGKLYAFFGPQNAPHLEWYTLPWLNSSMTGLLYWVFNQSVPFLLGMALFLVLPNSAALLFFYAVLFLCAPFPSVGLFPFMAWKVLQNGNFRPLGILKGLLTPMNLLAFPAVGLIALFFQSNISAGVTRFVFPENGHQWLLFSIWFLTEFGIWLAAVGKKWTPELTILLLTVTACAFFRLGGGSDFAMRAAIPAFFFLMLTVLRNWYETETSYKMRAFILLVLFLGAAVPLMEWKRCAGNTLMTCVKTLRQSEEAEGEKRWYIRDDRLDSVFDLRELEDPCWKNFSGRENSLFFTWFCRETSER